MLASTPSKTLPLPISAAGSCSESGLGGGGDPPPRLPAQACQGFICILRQCSAKVLLLEELRVTLLESITDAWLVPPRSCVEQDLGDTQVCALMELVYISCVERDGTRLVSNPEHGNILPGSGAIHLCAQLQKKQVDI